MNSPQELDALQRDADDSIIRRDGVNLIPKYAATIRELRANLATRDGDYMRCEIRAAGLTAERDFLCAKLEETRKQVVYGFYEEEVPMFTDYAGAHPELSNPVTVDECNGYVAKINQLKTELEVAKKWIKEKGRHHIACMKLDVYDERDHGCTCGYEDLTGKEKS